MKRDRVISLTVNVPHVGEMEMRLDYDESNPNINHAAICGACNYTPGTLLQMWTGIRLCPYRTPVYREAWYRGLYSACAAHMMMLNSEIRRTHGVDTEKLFMQVLKERLGKK